MLRELLEKWSGLEPERCHVLPVADLANVRRGGDYEWTEDHAVILAAVMEAIEARGYSPWRLSKDEDGFAADVTRYPSGYAVTVYGPDKCPTAVEALLTAYLAALEAEA